LAKPITRYNEVLATMIVWANQYRLAGLVSDFDAVFCGFDRELERVLIAEAKAQRKPAFQVINAILYQPLPISDRRTRMFRNIRRLIKRMMMHFFKCKFVRVPGLAGFGGCDRIFVMGRYVKDVLMSQGLEGSRIVVSGLPRFSHLFHYDIEHDSNGKDRDRQSFDILFLPAAYLWHRNPGDHKRQQQQVRELLSLVQELGENYRLVIKVHPREAEEYYDWISPNNQVRILSKDSNLHRAIYQSSCVVTNESAGMFEAIALKRPLVILSFPPMTTNGQKFLSPAASEPIPSADTPEELKNIIVEISKNGNKYEKLAREERAVLDYYMDPKTPQAAEIIAREILDFIL